MSGLNPMEPAEVLQVWRSAPRERVIVGIDSNACRPNPSAALSLTEDVKRFNAERAPGTPRLVACFAPLVVAEVVASLRRALKARFDERVVRAYLRDNQMLWLSMTKTSSLSIAQTLAVWHPTEDSWTKAKDSRSATVDWYIAAHYAGRVDFVVTNDFGAEWKGLPRAPLSAFRALLLHRGP